MTPKTSQIFNNTFSQVAATLIQLITAAAGSPDSPAPAPTALRESIVAGLASLYLTGQQVVVLPEGQVQLTYLCDGNRATLTTQPLGVEQTVVLAVTPI